MKKTTLLLVTLLFFSTLTWAVNYVNFNNSPEPFTVKVLETTVDRTIIKFQVNGYATEQVLINGKSYTILQEFRKESMIEEKGYPLLPRINRSLIIPDNGIMSYQVLSSNYIEVPNIDLAPSKGYLMRTVNPETVPYTFAEVYHQDAFYPEKLVNLREPYILRDYRGQVVELNAFQYNPVTRVLRVYTDVTLEVKKTSPGGVNVLNRKEPLTKLDPQFHKIYQHHFINYGLTDYPCLLEPGEMLIICFDSYMDLVAPLVEWKNQRGLPTTMVASSVAGSTADQIKEYIRGVYQTSDLTYVLLVGDAPQIPTFTGSSSDPVYGLLVGNDSYPEIFVGRFSAENRNQCETQVTRTLEYEKYPQASADWYHMGLGIASNEGPGHHGEYDFEHVTLIAYKLLDYTYTQVDSVYQPWGTTAMISNSVNNGRSMINYCGHGTTTSWASVTFNNGNVNDLVNDNMLPYITSVACLNGNFVSSTCFAEAWLRATNDVSGEPTGGIDAYMSKISQSWSPPMDAQDEAVDLMVLDSMRTYGGICFNGSMLMVDLNGAIGETELKAWTIFGDPSLLLRNDEPVNLVVTHNPILFLGTSTFDVIVMTPSGPLAEATVCGMNDEIYATGITNASGQVTLTFSPPPAQPGEFTLTVIGWNTTPYFTQIDIIPPSGPYVVYNNQIVQDDLTGNNNGQLDYGETVELGITVENVGVEVATDVSGTLSTTDTLVTINQNSAVFGTIPAGQTVTVERAFEFAVASTVSDGYPLIFTLTTTDGINSWQSNFSVIAHAPEVVFEDLVVDDEVGGNGNGCLDPGEIADLLVTLENEGSSDVDAVTALLTCADPYITITTATASYGTILAGGTAEGTYTVNVSNACPQQHTVDFTLNVSGAIGYANTTTFSTIVGNILYAPTGPDNYGYFAYDIHDSPLMPEYNWVEVNPEHGGAGTVIPFTADDQTVQVDLPFTFTYYGQDYTQISVCTNGWIAMGYTTSNDWSNSTIPNPDGPPSMIAPFWDDLSPQVIGDVVYYYDATDHYFVVEFDSVRQYTPTTAFESFEVILYDPSYYQTITGDGEILMQWARVSDPSSCTIGIENQTQTDGIQYLYNTTYDVHATPIEAEMAVLYTTGREIPDVTITLTPQSLPIIIPAIGGSFQYTLAIANSGTIISYFDAWTDALLPDSSLYGPILLRSNLSLAPGGTISRNMTQSVPGTAPAGDYIYYGKVGNNPVVIFDSDSFPFTKLAGDGVNSNYGEWTVSGWDEQPGFSTAVPESYFLSQNYPNPFNPETSISFGIPQNGKVSLKVYNLLGEVVATLIEGQLTAGYYEFKWNASGMSSGIYFYRLNAPGYTMTRKMMLIR